MSTAARDAVEQAARAAAVLADVAADPIARDEALRAHAEAVEFLRELADRRYSRTRAQVLRLMQIERSLIACTPGERAAIVCERLGISRSRYYELRAECPETSGQPSAMMRPTVAGGRR